MKKNKLIAKQQLQIEKFKKAKKKNEELKKEIIGKFYNIGQPLNDNLLKMDEKQMSWCAGVVELAKQIQ